jgi:RND family efflux transporter MFP subunit
MIRQSRTGDYFMRWLSRALLLIMIIFTSACSSQAEVDEPTPTPIPTAVRPTYTVQRGDIVVLLSLGGRVAPAESTPASFAVGGTVATVYVQEGDYVEKGQLLADLDVLKDLETQWARASADANYEETVSNDTIKRAEIKLQIAQLNLQDLQNRRMPKAQTQIAELQVQLAQMDLDEIKANPALHTAAAKVKDLEQQMADAQLHAPIAGYVLAASRPGQTVRTTSPSFEIGDISRLELGVLARDEDLKQMAEGMPITATLATQTEKQYAGTIRQLPYPYGSGKNVGEVRVALSESPEQGGYKLGDNMAIKVVVQYRHAVLWLPPEAIRTVGGRTFVVLQGGSDEQRADVKLGVQTQDRVEIAAGLAEGQLVVGP